jgi:hypothetical protein
VSDVPHLSDVPSDVPGLSGFFYYSIITTPLLQLFQLSFLQFHPLQNSGLDSLYLMLMGI